MAYHQSHDNELPGQTDSPHKLSRLKLPASLAGARVLDIGCNEGFFCNAAALRGAASVLGIDMDERFLSEARQRYQSDVIAFQRQGWSRLPPGPFDLILWTSAMHYELDPLAVLAHIRQILAPGGLFVLECGVVQSPRNEMVYALRHDGGLWYPTQGFLEDALTRAGFSYRVVSHPEMVGTDSVPRSVIHASVRVPTVLLVSGRSGVGKSNVADVLKSSATKIIALDYFVSRIGYAKWATSPLHKHIKDNMKPDALTELYESIDDAGMTEDYVSLICKGIAATDIVVIVEGFMTHTQLDAFRRTLAGRAKVWNVTS